jgi:hypothetical protein
MVVFSTMVMLRSSSLSETSLLFWDSPSLVVEPGLDELELECDRLIVDE